MARKLTWAVLLAALVVSGYSGPGPFSCGGQDPPPPMRVLDAGLDAAVVDLYAWPDRRRPDTTRDIWVLSDLGTPYSTCKVGRVRKLTPTPVAAGTGKSCGAGCKQVTFGALYSSAGVWDLWGDHLAYLGGVPSSVHLVHLKADKEWVLEQHPPRKNALSVTTTAVAVFKGKVAYNVTILWQDQSQVVTEAALLLYDIATQQETTLGCWVRSDPLWDLSHFGGSMSAMDFSEAGLVYAWYRGNPSPAHHYRFDLATGKETPVYDALYKFRLWGQQLVWEKYGGEVMVTDLKLSNTLNLSNHKEKQHQAAIEKQRVVWADHRGSASCANSEIYLYDLLTRKLEAVTSNTAAFQQQPDVYGDLVAWIARERNTSQGQCGHMYSGGGDIFVKDLKTAKTRKLDLMKGYKQSLRVWGDQIIFKAELDRSKNRSAIFSVDLK